MSRLVLVQARILASAEMLFAFLYAVVIILAERRALRPAARFAVSGVRHPAQTLRLLRYFWHEGEAFMPRSVRVDSLLKIGREHYRIGLSPSDRVDLLIAHHAALRRAFRRELLADFFDGAPIRLGEMAGEGRDVYEVLLIHAPVAYRQEGEATLTLRSRANGVRLADVTFVIGGSKQKAGCLRIGGAQGPPVQHGKAAIKAATKALDGLRPKAVVIEATYQFALCLGASTVYATSLSHHVLFVTPKAAMIHAGPYDLFWEELGGLRLPAGDYLLPRHPPHRDEAEVPAKRRKDWERRQTRLAQLAAQIAATMAALGDLAVAEEAERVKVPSR